MAKRRINTGVSMSFRGPAALAVLEALSGQRLPICSCNGTSLDHLCRVHGNHPSNIVPEHDPGECDNTHGQCSSEGKEV
jgi:hypothetical protein